MPFVAELENKMFNLKQNLNMETKTEIKDEARNDDNTMLAVRSLSDLRVGNWVQDTQHFLGYFQIEGVKSEYGGFIETPDQWIPFDEVAGIKLTDEWLKQFGFIIQGRRISNSWFYLWYDNDKIVFALAEMEEHTGAYIEVKTVHQLQNLYYSLMGQELVRQNDR